MVAESGAAFKDAGPSLGQIIDTSSSFIETAEANFDITTALIRDSRVGAADPGRQGLGDPQLHPRPGAVHRARVADNDKYLRSLIDNGSATANELRTFLEQNRVNLGQLINNLVTTNEVVVKHLKGIRQILVIYPYVVAGGFTVAKKNDDGTLRRPVRPDPHPGPRRLRGGLRPDQARRRRTRPTSRWTPTPAAPTAGKNLRGAEKAPNGRTGAAYRSPVATYDARPAR